MIDFTYAGYRKVLEYVKSQGYSIGPQRDFATDHPFLFLRHDVDISVAKAREFAELEYNLAVTSTYYFLMTSSYYNALTMANIRRLKDILEMGHEIGLHYDCTGFETLTCQERGRRISILAECLSEHLGRKINSISQHMPARTEIRLELPDNKDAYNVTFSRGLPYLSDSRRILNDQAFYGLFNQRKSCQLCIHPIWWLPKRKTREDVFVFIRKHLSDQMEKEISAYQNSINDFLKKDRP